MAKHILERYQKRLKRLEEIELVAINKLHWTEEDIKETKSIIKKIEKRIAKENKKPKNKK